MNQSPDEINTGVPPPLPAPAPGISLARQCLVILLSLCLGLFIADAVVSLVDDTLIVLFNVHLLGAVRSMVGFVFLLLTVLIYGLMGLTPMIPKRLFLPVTLFGPVTLLLALPCLIYFYTHNQQVTWCISFGELLCSLGILCVVQGGLKLRWPLFPEKLLKVRGFSWWNLSTFFMVNVFILLPAALAYLLFCTALGVDHFSAGFMKLHPGGLAVEVKQYVRADGKTIQLFPMSHIADAAFYQQIAQSFPTNSIVLREGVTDSKKLLTNTISYKRAAVSLGLAEQQKAFDPDRGEQVRADIDVDEFAPVTLDLLNFVMLIHAKGLNADNLSKLLQYPAPPGFEEQLLEDLLRKRNRHLLGEIKTRLAQTDHIVVPWGVAHMPGLAEEIEKSGFHLVETREYMNIRFHFPGGRKLNTSPPPSLVQPK